MARENGSRVAFYPGMLKGRRANGSAMAETLKAMPYEYSDISDFKCEFKMEHVMKRQVFDLLVLGLLVVLAVASAQAQSTIAKANVSFDFAVGDTRLPAGEYTIVSGAPDVAPELLVFRDGQGRAREVTMTTRMEPGNNNQPKLIFRRYGTRYFLSQVWLNAGESGCQVREGSQEKELAERGTEVQKAILLASAR